MIREDIDWHKLWSEFKTAEPFNHVVIDNFFNEDFAEKLEQEFPSLEETSNFNVYNNQLEIKKTLNKWDNFPPATYKAFTMFGRSDFLYNMRGFLGDPKAESLWFDYGLNGGGWHIHGNGGNLNMHLDYNLHPKLGEQRKINLIVYLTKGWQVEWGGGLELWSHNPETNRPKERVKVIDNIYNRAVIFDTTQNSWHGLPDFIRCPNDVSRKSIAGYFLTKAPENTEARGRALFAPREDQKNDQSVEELIRKRADVTSSKDVYKKS